MSQDTAAAQEAFDKDGRPANADPDQSVLWTRFPPEKAAGAAQHDRYHFDLGSETGRQLVTRINLALALDRPLLLTGPAGAGKSSVADGVAMRLGWGEPLKVTVTSRSEAEDLLVTFDHVRRLSDGSAGHVGSDVEYLRPGPIWRALAPEDVKAYYAQHEAPPPDLPTGGRVLLIDEIDKGDVDFANNLLDVFDGDSFQIPALDRKVPRRTGGHLLVVITSNGEQDLSAPFLRRCIQHRIDYPARGQALRIGLAWQERKPRAVDLTEGQIKDLVDLCLRGDEADSQVHTAILIDMIDATRDAMVKHRHAERFEQDRLFGQIIKALGPIAADRIKGSGVR